MAFQETTDAVNDVQAQVNELRRILGQFGSGQLGKDEAEYLGHSAWERIYQTAKDNRDL